jgi:hypothetical protein
MQLRALLISFLVWILYPAWLLAGAADYFCHRSSDIAHTSGRTESGLHVVQFLCIAAILILAVAFPVSGLTWAGMLLAATAHSVASYIDVAYSYQRRHVTAFEQQVHGYLDVIPWIAVALIGALGWDSIVAAAPAELLSGDRSVSLGGRVVLTIFALFAGIPVLEEFIRTARAGSGRAD